MAATRASATRQFVMMFDTFILTFTIPVHLERHHPVYLLAAWMLDENVPYCRYDCEAPFFVTRTAETSSSTHARASPSLVRKAGSMAQGWLEFICSSEGTIWLFQLSMGILGVLNLASMIEQRFFKARGAVDRGKIRHD